jgi:hypothetical protein
MGYFKLLFNMWGHYDVITIEIFQSDVFLYQRIKRYRTYKITNC